MRVSRLNQDRVTFAKASGTSKQDRLWIGLLVIHRLPLVLQTDLLDDEL